MIVCLRYGPVPVAKRLEGGNFRWPRIEDGTQQLFGAPGRMQGALFCATDRGGGSMCADGSIALRVRSRLTLPSYIASLLAKLGPNPPSSSLSTRSLLPFEKQMAFIDGCTLRIGVLG